MWSHRRKLNGLKYAHRTIMWTLLSCFTAHIIITSWVVCVSESKQWNEENMPREIVPYRFCPFNYSRRPFRHRIMSQQFLPNVYVLLACKASLASTESLPCNKRCPVWDTNESNFRFSFCPDFSRYVSAQFNVTASAWKKVGELGALAMTARRQKKTGFPVCIHVQMACNLIKKERIT